MKEPRGCWVVLARVGMFGALVCGNAGPDRALAQTAAPPSESPAEADPFKCWWKTDKSAVHVGERFTLVLTCAAAETDRITAVPDLSSLEAGGLRIPPFEVVSGTTPQDIRDAPWRYIQREYVVRLLGEGFFGRDVDIPSVQVPFAVHAAGGEGGAEGRSQPYALPALPIRVASLVPLKATDIRDSSDDTFATVEARRRRATNELVAAAILLSFAVVALGLAGARAVRRRLNTAPARIVPHLSPHRLLGGCVRGMDRLKAEVAREGWTVERASRALTLLRVAGAVALGRPVTQTLEDDPRVVAREGQLELRRGVFRRRRVMISAPTTTVTIAQQLAGGHDQPLEEIRETLGVFGSARYGREGTLDAAALDAALETGADALRRLRSLRYRPRRSQARTAGVAGGSRA